MSDCNSCVHKGDRCFCPPDRYCVAYEKEDIVKHTFEFYTSKDWAPGDGCWMECPFSELIPFGKVCKFLSKGFMCCPFLANKN